MLTTTTSKVAPSKRYADTMVAGEWQIYDDKMDCSSFPLCTTAMAEIFTTAV
jgi:hypothetical protein